MVNWESVRGDITDKLDITWYGDIADTKISSNTEILLIQGGYHWYSRYHVIRRYYRRRYRRSYRRCLTVSEIGDRRRLTVSEIGDCIGDTIGNTNVDTIGDAWLYRRSETGEAIGDAIGDIVDINRYKDIAVTKISSNTEALSYIVHDTILAWNTVRWRSFTIL